METRSGYSFQSFRELLEATIPEHIKESVLQGVDAIRANDPEYLAQEQAERDQRARQASVLVKQREARANSGLEKGMWLDTFQAYTPITRSQKNALRISQLFCSHYPKVKGRGVMLFGTPGTGKSHLGRAIAVQLLNKIPTPAVRYYYVPQIERTLKREAKQREDLKGTGRAVPDTEQDMLNCDVLILDDITKLGQANADWFVNLMGAVIDQAERTGSPVIVATANGPDRNELVAARPYFDQTKELIEARYGEPFLSRLKGLMHWVEVLGPDGRQESEETEKWWAQ